MSETMELEVLNTGSGHVRVTFDPGNEAEVEKARRTVELMLLRGFALFVDTGDGQLKRVKGFSPNVGAYLVETVPDEAQQGKAEADATPGGDSVAAKSTCWCGRKFHHRGRHAKTKPVPVKGTRTVAVGRTAGG